MRVYEENGGITMMVEKLKVSQEVADSIEYIKEKNYGFNGAMSLHASDGWAFEETCSLSKLSMEQLATALIVGYEVAMTPYEEIAKEYKNAEQEKDACFDVSDKNLAYENQGIMSGIKFTLNTLGITIEGVNDNG